MQYAIHTYILYTYTHIPTQIYIEHKMHNVFHINIYDAWHNPSNSYRLALGVRLTLLFAYPCILMSDYRHNEIKWRKWKTNTNRTSNNQISMWIVATHTFFSPWAAQYDSTNYPVSLLSLWIILKYKVHKQLNEKKRRKSHELSTTPFGPTPNYSTLTCHGPKLIWYLRRTGSIVHNV